ncbi:hypothetical protein HY625_01455 [Candidatus Uhrbacteria bacterium]|nr:hypothetical protein [Candidatus Uhrbacteria bacterium]
MLDQNDLKQIGVIIDDRLQKTESRIDDRFKKAEDRIVEKTVTAVVTQVGEFIDQNVLPAIEEIIEEKLEVKLEQKLEEKLTDKLRPLPDRDFMTRQTAEVKGEFVATLRKEDEKVDLHIKFSHENKVLTDDQRARLRAIHVFPSLEI